MANQAQDRNTVHDLCEVLLQYPKLLEDAVKSFNNALSGPASVWEPRLKLYLDLMSSMRFRDPKLQAKDIPATAANVHAELLAQINAQGYVQTDMRTLLTNLLALRKELL